VNQIMQHDDFGAGGPVAGHYLADKLGAPFKVYLASGVLRAPDPVSGKITTDITDLPGLIAAVVRSRVLHSRKLSGADLRFIRQGLCLKSKTLAAAVDLTPEHYSRCETGQKTMSAATEKVYRCYTCLLTFARDQEVQHMIREQRAGKAKPVSTETGQKALAAFQKLFFEMEINPVYDPDEELEFTFWRRCPGHSPCGDDDDAEWDVDDVDPIAA
jgi:hypothetical protein